MPSHTAASPAIKRGSPAITTVTDPVETIGQLSIVYRSSSLCVAGSQVQEPYGPWQCRPLFARLPCAFSHCYLSSQRLPRPRTWTLSAPGSAALGDVISVRSSKQRPVKKLPSNGEKWCASRKHRCPRCLHTDVVLIARLNTGQATHPKGCPPRRRNGPGQRRRSLFLTWTTRNAPPYGTVSSAASCA
jgi:hypothetical protein